MRQQGLFLAEIQCAQPGGEIVIGQRGVEAVGAGQDVVEAAFFLRESNLGRRRRSEGASRPGVGDPEDVPTLPTAPVVFT